MKPEQASTRVKLERLELGGFSAFLYAIEARELITDRITELGLSLDDAFAQHVYFSKEAASGGTSDGG